MDNLLSIVTFIPRLRPDSGAFPAWNDEAAARNAKWLAMIATGDYFRCLAVYSVPVRQLHTGFQMVEERDLAHGHAVQDGRGRNFRALRDAHNLHDATGHRGQLGCEIAVKEYMIAFLLLETLMLGVFMALDLVCSTVFFEAGSDPDVPDHRHLGRCEPHLREFKFFLYTFLGSVLMLVAMVAML